MFVDGIESRKPLRVRMSLLSHATSAGKPLLTELAQVRTAACAVNLDESAR